MCVYVHTYISCPEAETGWALSPELSEPGCCREPGGPVDTGTFLSAAGPLLASPHGIEDAPTALHPPAAASQWETMAHILASSNLALYSTPLVSCRRKT